MTQCWIFSVDIFNMFLEGDALEFRILRVHSSMVDMDSIAAILFLIHFREAKSLRTTKQHLLASEEGTKAHKTAIKYLFVFSNRINFITVDL